MATHVSDLFVLLLFVQFIKLRCRFCSHTVIDHTLYFYLFVDLESEFNCGAKMIQTYKIIRIVRALSLVNRCVYMRVSKHGCYITRILIGYVLSDACFDWLVYYEQEVHFFLGKLEEFSTVLQTLDCVSGLNNCLEF